jgi:apolipoprotein N-acyltransferase
LKKIQLFGFSLLAGILLFAAWPVSNLTFIIFFAWLPLLFVADKSKKIFFYAFIALFSWNALTTWWIWNSTDVGSIAAIIANSLLMCVPWIGYFIFKNKFGKNIGYVSLVVFWMLFEYIHLNWQISWPWLSLGNAFAAKTEWIQWYEFTGIGGGTLWILLVNILLYEIIKGWKVEGRRRKVIGVSILIILIVLPIAFSQLLSVHFIKGGTNKSVVIVQPNIDPYQKFESLSVSSQLQKLIDLSEKEIDSSTKLVVWPETALSANIGINEVAQSPVYKIVFDFTNRHPNVTLLTGIETYKILGLEKTSPYARKSAQDFYYDSYNAAVSIKANEPLQFYIKSKLVPGVETLPSFLNILSPVFEKFGGTTGGYAKDTASKVFYNAGNPFVTAPVICYESVYGEYVASYIQKGANIITIITNDGWWGNTPGHKQHLALAKLRAIETRRWVVRSANTGISAVIDEYGVVKTSKPWNTADVIKYNIPIKNNLTFYVKNGDYLYKIAAVFALLMLVWNLGLKLKKLTVKDAKKR